MPQYERVRCNEWIGQNNQTSRSTDIHNIQVLTQNVDQRNSNQYPKWKRFISAKEYKINLMAVWEYQSYEPPFLYTQFETVSLSTCILFEYLYASVPLYFPRNTVVFPSLLLSVTLHHEVKLISASTSSQQSTLQSIFHLTKELTSVDRCCRKLDTQKGR